MKSASLLLTPSQPTCRKTEQALLRGARAVTATAASPSSPIFNAVTVRAMLPAVALTITSLGAVKVKATILLFLLFALNRELERWASSLSRAESGLWITRLESLEVFVKHFTRRPRGHAGGSTVFAEPLALPDRYDSPSWFSRSASRQNGDRFIASEDTWTRGWLHAFVWVSCIVDTPHELP